MSSIKIDQLSGLVYGSFAADSLALGAHWIYDQEELHGKFGRVTDLLGPLADSYHPHKSQGEQTHYGDQALVLLDSLAASGGYDHADFATRWRLMWNGYPDYFDHATKETLANLETGGRPSDSEELGGAARIAPLIAQLANESLPTQIAAARDQTGLTHGSLIAQDSAEFLTRIVHAILAGSEIWPAIEGAAEAKYAVLSPKENLAQVEATNDLNAAAAAKKLGLACPAHQALPTTLALLHRFANAPETAIIENVMAGGDSAARALSLGMILGARHGKSAIPSRWISALAHRDRIDAFLAKLS